jgi:hypothetical protein
MRIGKNTLLEVYSGAKPVTRALLSQHLRANAQWYVTCCQNGMRQTAQPGSRGRFARHSRITSRVAGLFGTGCLCLLGCPTVLAEEAVHSLSAAAYAPLLAYAVVPAASFDVLRFTHSTHQTESPVFAPSAHSLFVTEVTLARSSSSAAPADERYYGEVSRQDSVGGGRLAEGSIVLFRTRVPTRFSYQSYAGLQSGYGQVFSTADTIGRSRTNGAGVDDPSCVYLKMSLNF